MEERCSSNGIIKNSKGKDETRICHCCRKIATKYNSIQCSKESCNSVYCLQCFSNKYYTFKKIHFFKLRQSNKWICFKCKLVCNCNKCWRSRSMAEHNNCLKLKRSRIAKKISKHYLTICNDQDQCANSLLINIRLNTSEENKFTRKENNTNGNGDTIEKDFLNCYQNTFMNQIICKAANTSLSSVSKIPKKKSNKPCILCAKFKCPSGVDIIKFKTYDDYISFLITLFKDVESKFNKQSNKGEANRSNSEVLNNKSELQLIMNQKKYLPKIQENIKLIIDNKLKGPKRFCSNCIANLFREHNCLFTIFDSLKDEDEQPSLEPKKKLEIMNGIHQLILKEGESFRGGKIDNYLLEVSAEDKKYKENNIFNEIFSGNKIRKDNEINGEELCNIQPNLIDKIEMFNDSRQNPKGKADNNNVITNNNINFNMKNNININNNHTYGQQNDLLNFLHPNCVNPRYNTNIINGDQFFNNQRLNCSSQNIEESDSIYIDSLGFPLHPPPMKFPFPINYNQEGYSIMNIGNSSYVNVPNINGNFTIDNMIHPYMINQMNHFPNINPTHVGPQPGLNNLFEFANNMIQNINPNSAYFNNQNSVVNNYETCFKKLENLNSQLDFTMKLISKGRNDFEGFLSQYIETNESEQKGFIKTKLDETIYILHQQVLICNTLLNTYRNELAMNQMGNISFT